MLARHSLTCDCALAHSNSPPDPALFSNVANRVNTGNQDGSMNSFTRRAPTTGAIHTDRRIGSQ